MIVHKFVTILDIFQKELIEMDFLGLFKTLNGYWSYLGYIFTFIL